MTDLLKIEVRYVYPELSPLEYIEGDKSDWIDLRCGVPGGVTLKAGEFRTIDLGVAIKLPEGYEAHIAPRGSTFKTYGVIQTNSVGVVDNKYSGNNDIWKMPVYAVRDTFIPFNDRICQFRIMKKMDDVVIETVEKLDGPDRGGFGTTGRK